MRLLGLTGDIACGKSTVAQMLAEHGAALLDADQLVRDLYADNVFASQVAALFEQPILDENGGIDRGALGAIVFADARALRRLEALVHPAVAALRDVRIELLSRQQPPPQVIVLEAVKLIESRQAAACDEVWCVTCRHETQLNRLITHRGMNLAAAQARLVHQPSFERKAEMLQQQSAGREVPLILVPNDGTPEALQKSVDENWQRFITKNAEDVPTELDAK